MKQIILVLCLLVSGVGMVLAQDAPPQETADVQAQEPAAADAPEQLWDAANTAYINGDIGHGNIELVADITPQGSQHLLVESMAVLLLHVFTGSPETLHSVPRAWSTGP